MTQISESRTRELLQWLDDQAGDHTHLFEQMARYRDAAALIRQLQAAEQRWNSPRGRRPSGGMNCWA